MYNEDLKERRRQRQQKSHLKKVFALFQTLSFLFHVVQFVTEISAFSVDLRLQTCVSALPAGKPTPYNSRHSEHAYRVLPAST